MKNRTTKSDKKPSELKRITICLDPQIHAAGVSLAGDDQRSFSSWVAKMIDDRSKKSKAA